MGEETPETCWAVNKRQDNKLENCCIWFVIYLNWWMKFWYFDIVPKYWKFATFSKDLLAFFILWSCSAFCCQDLNGSSGVWFPVIGLADPDVSKVRSAFGFSGLFDPEDGVSFVLRNVEKHPHNYTASRFRRLMSLAAPLFDPDFSRYAGYSTCQQLLLDQLPG